MWDPAPVTLDVLKTTFPDPKELVGDPGPTNYCIGVTIGQRAAREYVALVKKSPTHDDYGIYLQQIAMDMLMGTSRSDSRRRGEAIGFFSELEVILSKTFAKKSRRTA